jgi:hypothetical protein
MKQARYHIAPYVAALMVWVFLLPACRKYTEVEPVSQYSIQQAFADVPNATTAVLGVYDELMGDNAYGIRLSLYYPYDSDEAIVSGNIDNGRRGVGRYQLQVSNTEIANPFRALYRGIEKANLCIEQLPLMQQYNTGTDAEKKELRRLYGEVLTLRAQFYLELVRNWGDVPAPMIPAYRQTNQFVPRSDRDDVMDILLNDLNTATSLLPWRTKVARNERITKGAAKALRARMALYRGGYALRGRKSTGGSMQRKPDYLAYYQIARDECAGLMANRNQHTLNPSFEDVWHKYLCGLTPDPYYEIIFEAGAGGGNSNADSRLGQYNGPVLSADSRYGIGGGGINCLPTLFYAYDSADKRRDVAVTLYRVNDASNIKSVSAAGLNALTDGKFRRDWRTPLLPGTVLNTGYNWPIIRFADVLLMFAEAENELNAAPTQAAKDALYEVRLRAFNGNVALAGSIPTDKTSFFNAVVNERLLELSGEGIRKYDLIRWNLLSAKIADTRARLQQMRDAQPPYSHVPQYVYYKNNGEELQWYASLYKPGLGTGTPPQGFIAVAWGQSLTSSVIDGKPLWQAMAGYFTTGKSELLPFDQATLDAYQGRLEQNPGY